MYINCELCSKVNYSNIWWDILQGSERDTRFGERRFIHSAGAVDRERQRENFIECSVQMHCII